MQRRRTEAHRSSSRCPYHALLTGSALVFGVLAIAMILTRRIDWSALSRRLAAARADRGAGATAAGAG